MKAVKNMRGEWSCANDVPLPDGRTLKISTHKTYGGELVTSGTVGKVDSDGYGFSYMMYQDYSKRLIAMKYPRITAKVIEAQHAEAMANIEDIKTSIAEFYKAKESATV